jgi:hypothetical protein
MNTSAAPEAEGSSPYSQEPTTGPYSELLIKGYLAKLYTVSISQTTQNLTKQRAQNQYNTIQYRNIKSTNS